LLPLRLTSELSGMNSGNMLEQDNVIIDDQNRQVK